MARLIVVASTKGGVSKSSLVYYIQQYLVDIGAKAVILDLDKQKTITTLSKDLGKNLPIINPPEYDELHTLPWEFIVVDTPPYNAAALRDMYRQSAFVLIPVKPSIIDVRAAQTVIQSLRDDYPGKRFSCILTQVRHGTSYNQQIRDYLHAEGIPLMKTEMAERVAYSRGLLHSHLRDENDEKALHEIAAIVGEILAIMARDND